jgi:hypothetical protein
MAEEGARDFSEIGLFFLLKTVHVMKLKVGAS